MDAQSLPSPALLSFNTLPTSLWCLSPCDASTANLKGQAGGSLSHLEEGLVQNLTGFPRLLFHCCLRSPFWPQPTVLQPNETTFSLLRDSSLFFFF